MGGGEDNSTNIYEDVKSTYVFETRKWADNSSLPQRLVEICNLPFTVIRSNNVHWFPAAGKGIIRL